MPPSARPVLELASALKVPVFMHPVSDPHADVLVKQGGRAANSAGRGLVNGAAFLSLLHNDVLEGLPDLNVVFTALAAGALIQRPIIPGNIASRPAHSVMGSIPPSAASSWISWVPTG